MGWTLGAALRVCSRRAPHPLPQAGARMTVPRLRSGAFDCSWHSGMPLVLRFALSAFIRRGLCLFPVAVGGCGRCLSFWRSGASARPGVSFVFLFWRFAPCFASLLVGGCGWFLSFDAGRCCWCSSFGALWLLPALGCLSFGGCVVFVVCCSGLPGASTRPGCLRSFSLL